MVALNDDVELEPHWLSAMVDYMEAHPRAGLATPLILLASDRGLVNTAGNALHFTGMYSGRGKNRPRAEFAASGPVGAISGCCFIARRELLDRIGGFSSPISMPATQAGMHPSRTPTCPSAPGWRATRLYSWRKRRCGISTRNAPCTGSAFSPTSSDGTCSRSGISEPRTLLRLLPLFLVLEAMTLAYAARRGPSWVAGKFRLWFWMILAAPVCCGRCARGFSRSARFPTGWCSES